MKKLLFLTYFLSAACIAQTYQVTFKNEIPEYITINSQEKNKLEIASGLGCYQSIEFFKDYFELKLCMHYFTPDNDETKFKIYYDNYTTIRKEFDLNLDNNGEMHIKVEDMFTHTSHNPFPNESLTEVVKIKKVNY